MLHCFWVFVSDPSNQATLKWLCSGVAAAISGLWVVFLFWFQHRNKDTPQSPSKRVWLTAFTTVGIVLVAGGWLYSEAEYYCPDCHKFTKIEIKAPLNGARISTPAVVYGKAAASQACRFVYVLVSAMMPGVAPVATGPVQPADDGDWSAPLDLNHVNPGGLANVQAFLTDRRLASPVIEPPSEGHPSNIVQLWRQ